MEELLNTIIEFLLPQNDFFLYIFLFISAVIENLFPPIPGDTITAFGAFLVGTGRLNYLFVYISTTIGSVIGFMALFFVGRFLDREFFMQKDFKFFSVDSIVNAENWFRKYGFWVVLGNRFLPGIRSVISVVSGISNLSIIKVFIFSFVSAAIWNLIWIQVGYTLGNNWDVVKEKMGSIIKNYNLAVGMILTALVIAYIVYKVVKKRQNKSEND